MPPASAGITYLDGRRFIRSLAAAADWVDSRRDDINRINVFPVPDGDTGTNFAVTLRAAAEAARSLGDAPLSAIAEATAEASVFAARGNSGLLLSQFLLGFRDAVGPRPSLDTRGLADAMRAGADQLAAALDEPVEGTILTVCRDTARSAEVAAAQSLRFDQVMPRILDGARVSLERTPELLAALREAGVVDAGAQAFVAALEGVVRLIEGRPVETAAVGPPIPAAAAHATVAAGRDFRFCTEVLVRSDRLPASATARAALRSLGASIVVLNTGTALKLHVHTDTPERVFELAGRWGTIEERKAEDMRVQHQALADGPRRGIAIVVDSSSDLSDGDLERTGVEMVPVQVVTPERTYQDRVDLLPEEVYRLMRGGERLTTSQPAPGMFARAFSQAREGADEVLCLTLAAALSGTFASAQTAARSIDPAITVVDSRSVSLGLGMLAVRAAELAGAGWPVSRIVAELQRIRQQSGGLFTVDQFDQLLRSGRVGRARAWLGALLDLKPILEVDVTGRVVPLDRVRGRDQVITRVYQHLERRLPPRPQRLRLGVVHADAEDTALRVKRDLERRYHPLEILVGPVATAIAVHVGPGAWGVFWQLEDGPETGEI